jgi:hypothetical protein
VEQYYLYRMVHRLFNVYYVEKFKIYQVCLSINVDIKWIYLIVFHGTQSTIHVNFHNVRDDKKTSENGETMEGTLV